MTPVSVVVPCFNEAGRLPVERFERGLAELPDVAFVFVDDGSTDATAAMLERLRTGAPDRVRVLRLPRNVGKGEAVRAGLLDALQRDARYVGYWDAGDRNVPGGARGAPGARDGLRGARAAAGP